MSDIPSNLSRWEPSRSLKAGFLAFAILCVLTLFGAKLFKAYVVDRRDLEDALGVDRSYTPRPAPAVSAKDRDGREVSLASLRGKVVFLNLWATWCGPCREEMPSIADLARSMNAEDAVFLAVSIDESWEPVDEFLAGEVPPYRVLLDADRTFAEAFGTSMFPETFVIDRDGTVLYKFAGARDWASVAAAKVLERAGARRVLHPVAQR